MISGEGGAVVELGPDHLAFELVPVGLFAQQGGKS